VWGVVCARSREGSSCFIILCMPKERVFSFPKQKKKKRMLTGDLKIAERREGIRKEYDYDVVALQQRNALGSPRLA
jgi:hypothetical protein